MMANRREGKIVGGITGKGFLRGTSGNPQGRPRTRGLVNALRAKMAQVAADGRLIEDHVVEVLIREALSGRHPVAAVEAIMDRVEGRPKQQLDVANLTLELQSRSDRDLRHYLKHGDWPESDAAEAAKPESEPEGVQ